MKAMRGRKFMIATASVHKLICTGRDSPEDLCLVGRETPTHYVGGWVYGIGLFDVFFPKDTTRELTEAERADLRGKEVGTTFAGNLRLDIDDERPLVPYVGDPMPCRGVS